MTHKSLSASMISFSCFSSLKIHLCFFIFSFFNSDIFRSPDLSKQNQYGRLIVLKSHNTRKSGNFCAFQVSVLLLFCFLVLSKQSARSFDLSMYLYQSLRSLHNWCTSSLLISRISVDQETKKQKWFSKLEIEQFEAQTYRI